MIRYRYIRGEVGNYEGESFLDNEEARDAEAQQWADRDGDEVLLEFQAEDGTWWCTGVKYPAGQEPPPIDYTKRFSATAVMPGDEATIFGAPSGQFGRVSNSDHRGRVLRKAHISELWYGVDGWRFEFTDGRLIDTIDHAVTTIHDLDISESLEAL